MKKKLVHVFLLGVFLFIASKAFVTFTAYQTLSSIKSHYKNDFLLTYEWISSALDGSVTIEGVELTPYALKKTFKIKQITFQYRDYLSLVSKFPVLEKGNVDQLISVSLPSIQAEMKGKSFRDLLAGVVEPAWLAPFDLYGCGPHKHLTPADYLSMGINQLEASLTIKFDHRLNDEFLSISLDRNELGITTIETSWPSRTIENFITQLDLNEFNLKSLKLGYQDAGLFRRFNILCNKGEAGNRAEFSANSALAWKNAMYAQGLLVNDRLVELYATYLLQGGSLVFEAGSKEGVSLNTLKSLVNKDVIKHFDVKLKLNEKIINSAELYVDGSIIYPPPKEIEVETQPSAEVTKFQPGYKTIDLGFLDKHLGRKIRVKMLDQKEYIGMLHSVTEYNLELSHKLPGGVVHYPLMLNEIQALEVWMNQE